MADYIAVEFNNMIGSTVYGQPVYDIQNDILCIHPPVELPSYFDPDASRLPERTYALENTDFKIGCPDSRSKRSKRTVGAGMTVSHNHCIAGMNETLLGEGEFAAAELFDRLSSGAPVEGLPGVAPFPKAYVQVLAPTPTPTATFTPSATPTSTNTPTATATPTPAKRYLPITYKRWGASGWTSLNADGDRALADYQVWGYVDVDGNVEFAQYGFYLAAANQLSWFGNGITADGEVVPGLTPVGH